MLILKDIPKSGLENRGFILSRFLLYAASQQAWCGLSSRMVSSGIKELRRQDAQRVPKRARSVSFRAGWPSRSTPPPPQGGCPRDPPALASIVTSPLISQPLSARPTDEISANTDEISANTVIPRGVIREKIPDKKNFPTISDKSLKNQPSSESRYRNRFRDVSGYVPC